MTTYHIVCKTGVEKAERNPNSMNDSLIRRIDKNTGVAEWHTLHEWNVINGYEAVEGDVVLPDKLNIQNEKEFDNFSRAAKVILSKMIPDHSHSIHQRLTPCFRCGEVYGPGMPHRCK